MGNDDIHIAIRTPRALTASTERLHDKLSALVERLKVSARRIDANEVDSLEATRRAIQPRERPP